jgi:hypothetical protein
MRVRVKESRFGIEAQAGGETVFYEVKRSAPGRLSAAYK